MPYQNPYLTNPYMQQAIVPPMMQQMIQQTPALQQQQASSSIRVSGRDEAMNRFLMMYPANMLVPGFISEALFDINGKQFHALSIEADGSRNLETFDYQIHVDQQAGPDYVSRAEFQGLVDKINQLPDDRQQVLAEEMLAWFLEHHAIEVVDAVSTSLGRPVCVNDRCLGG